MADANSTAAPGVPVEYTDFVNSIIYDVWKIHSLIKATHSLLSEKERYMDDDEAKTEIVASAYVAREAAAKIESLANSLDRSTYDYSLKQKESSK